MEKVRKSDSKYLKMIRYGCHNSVIANVAGTADIAILFNLTVFGLGVFVF